MAKKKKMRLKIFNIFRKKKKKISNESQDKKLSLPFIIGLLVLALVLFIVSYIVLGFVLAVCATFLFLLVMLFTQILDNTKKNSRLRKFIKVLVIIGLVFCIIGILGFIAFFIYVIIESPDFDVDKLNRTEVSEVYDKDNNLVYTLGSENRVKVSYSDLPEVFVDALVATEDSRFFQHNGFDAPRFTKAVLGQLLGRADAGGGSTLTMQVSKNNFTSRDAEGFGGLLRKFTDIYVSIFKLEKAYTKEEIIEFYVNDPFLGSNSYGIEQAAQTYFNKSISDVNLSEAALLAGLFQAPGDYDPYPNPENAKERRDTVLSLMVKHGYITKEEADIAAAISVQDLLSSSSITVNEYQGYVDTVLKEIENKTGLDPYKTSMEIYTNMDSVKQAKINKIYLGETYSWPNDTVQSGLAAIETHTGKVIAIGNGRNNINGRNNGARLYNYATDIDRQIGSTAKPLFDYGPGIEYNNWSTGQTFVDTKHKYTNGGYMENWDGAYRGAITLRYALSDSRNVPALIAFQSVDNNKIKEFVTNLGMKPEIDSNGYLHEAHSVGAFNGSNPLQLSAAYAAFSNGGYYYEPYTVNKIVLKDSNETIEFESESTKVKAMSEATAYMITSVLQDVARNIGITGVVNSQVASKTGSTNYDSQTRRELGYPYSATPDGWLVGYTPTISMAIWAGYNENIAGQYLTQSQIITLRTTLFRACEAVVFDNDGAQFVKPSSVVWVTVEKGSDPLALPSSNTPDDKKITELFKKGTEPTEVSSTYYVLDNPSGLKATYSNGNVKLTWNGVSRPSNAKDSYGELGYRVYYNGTDLGFTTNTSFTYATSNPYGTYTVKTSYSKVTTNMSSGVSYDIQPDVIFTYNDRDEEIVVGSSFSIMENPITVTADGKDVTSSADFSYEIYDETNQKKVDSIDTSVANTYTITYYISYSGKSDSYKKKLTIN